MPTFAKGASNHFSLDGPSYAEPILTLPYSSDDSNRFSSADPTQASTTAAANSTDHQSFPLPSDISDIPSPPFTTRTKSISSQSPSKSSFNNSVHGSSSAITPPTTSSSRNPSELNLDEIFATSDPLTHSKSHSPDLKHGFSQHFKPPENPYSQTGFDLIGALARVVNRPDPKVKIGAVDASAALVVVDARQNDLPIIFATPSFSLLTGYKTEEIIGQNCRFLQKPFNPNSANQPTDQTTNCRATLQIRAHIQAGREIQSSIINYRKDGRAFVNLVTVIPIAWNSSGISHFVGFQADIAALTSESRDFISQICVNRPISDPIYFVFIIVIGGLGIPPSPKSRSNLLMAKQHNVNTITETSTSQKTLNLVSVTPQVATPESMVPSSTAQAHDAIDDLSNTSSYYQTVLQEVGLDSFL
jgi:PAS domain S-box-containing protein